MRSKANAGSDSSDIGGGIKSADYELKSSEASPVSDSSVESNP